MKYEWRNDGEPIDGFYEAVVDMQDGTTPQVFRGASYKAVADALLKAQAHATDRIIKLRQEQRPTPPKSTVPAANPLTPDERMQLAQDISDPAKSDAAVERILLAKGVNLTEVRGLIAREHERQVTDAAIAETHKFAAETPDWQPTAHNMQTLVTYMQSQGMQPTAVNFTTAFEALTAAGLLQRREEEPEPEAEPRPASVQERISPGATRPRTTLRTGISASGAPPATQQRPKYTKRDLEKMPLAEYQRKYTSEPGFAAAAAAAR